MHRLNGVDGNSDEKQLWERSKQLRGFEQIAQADVVRTQRAGEVAGKTGTKDRTVPAGAPSMVASMNMIGSYCWNSSRR